MGGVALFEEIALFCFAYVTDLPVNVDGGVVGVHLVIP